MSINLKSDLNGQRGVVIGTGVMGKVIAKTLAQNGMELLLFDVTYRSANKLAREIRDDGGKAKGGKLDLSRPTACAKIHEKVDGPIDFLMISSGVGAVDMITTQDAEKARWLMQVNCHGPVSVIQSLWQKLKDGEGGRIAAISSIASLIAMPERLSYITSKFAFGGALKAIANQSLADGIKVIDIAPGRIAGEMCEAQIARSPNQDVARFMANNTQACGHPIDADEVAAEVLAFASGTMDSKHGHTTCLSSAWGPAGWSPIQALSAQQLAAAVAAGS